LTQAASSGQPAAANADFPFVVMVDDNARYMDEDERWEQGAFATLEEARMACIALVDACLSRLYREGMDAEKLYAHYSDFGDDPFIVGPGASGHFSASKYAQERAAEICAVGKE